MTQPFFPRTISAQSRDNEFLTVKTVVRKTHQNNGHTGSSCLDKAVLAQGGGGGGNGLIEMDHKSWDSTTGFRFHTLQCAHKKWTMAPLRCTLRGPTSQNQPQNSPLPNNGQTRTICTLTLLRKKISCMV